MISFKIENEFDLHTKVVNFIKQFQKSKRLLFTTNEGELQDTSDKRINSYRKGYTAGMPDFILYNPTRKYTSLVIEFKSPTCNGQLSDKQEYVLKHFKELNYKVIISNDYDKIIIKVNKYIELVRINCNLCKNKFKCENTLSNHKKYFHRVTNEIIELDN